MNFLKKYYKLFLLLLLFFAVQGTILISSDIKEIVIVSKAFFFQLITEILFFIWVILALYKKEFRIELKNPLFIFPSLFIFSVFISNIFAYDSVVAFGGTLERFDGFIIWFHYYLFYIVILGFLQNKKRWVYFIYNLILAGLFLSLYVIFFQLNLERVYSFLGNPLFLANFMIFEIFFTIFLISYHRIKNKKYNLLKNIILVFLSILFFYILLKTGSRGPLLGLIIGLIVGGFYYGLIEKKNKVLKYSIIFFVTLAIFLGGLFLKYKDQISEYSWVQNINILKRASEVSLDGDKTTRFRLANWSMAVEGWKEKPFLGIGQENYSFIYIKYFNSDKLYDNNEWFDKSHNMFLDYLVSFGIIGFILFILILYYAFKLVLVNKKLNNFEKSILLAILVFYIISGTTMFNTISSYIFFYVFLAFIYFLFKDEKNKQVFKTNFINNKFKIFIIIFSLFFLVWSLYFYIYKSSQSIYNFYQFSNFYLENRESLLKENTETSLLPAIEKIKDEVKSGNFIREDLFLFMARKMHYLNNQDEKTESLYLTTLNKLFESLKKDRGGSIKIYFVNALALKSMGEFAEAEKVYKTMYSLYPKNYYIIRKIINILVDQNKMEEAQFYYDKYYKYTSKDPFLKKK